MVTDKTAEDWYKAATLGAAKLQKKQRLEIVLYLERTLKIKDLDEFALANDLGVSQRQLKQLRKEAWVIFAKAITPETAIEMMSVYVLELNELIRQAEEGIKGCKAGTLAHQQYVRLKAELWDSKITRLQSVGAIPKELGRLTSLTEEWEAKASPADGLLSVNRLENAQTPAGVP